MKSKIFLFSILSFFVLSCSSDDDSPSEPQIPEEEKLIDNILSEELNYYFEYNPDKTIHSLNISNFYLFEYVYENQQISSIQLLANGQILEYFLEYDNNGKISSFSLDDEIIPVTYNAAENYYLYQKPNGDEFTLFLTDHGDAYRIIHYEEEYDETRSVVYLYEENANGALTNSNNISIPTMLIMGDMSFSYFFFPVSKKPVQTISYEAGNVTLENQLDEQNFIKESTITNLGAEGIFMQYNYTQL